MLITYTDLLTTMLALHGIRETGDGVLSAKDVEAIRFWLRMNAGNMGEHTAQYFSAVLTSHENLRTERLLIALTEEKR